MVRPLDGFEDRVNVVEHFWPHQCEMQTGAGVKRDAAALEIEHLTTLGVRHRFGLVLATFIEPASGGFTRGARFVKTL